MELLKTAIRLLEIDGQLPTSYRPHKLSGITAAAENAI